MNRVNVTGRLTKDPDVRYTNDNLAIATFTVAVDSYGREKRTDFPRVTAFGKQAETIEKYLSKGSLVGIDGRIQTGSYEKNGQKVFTTDVIAEKVDFLGNSTKNAEKSNQAVSEVSGELTQGAMPAEGFVPLDEEDLPF